MHRNGSIYPHILRKTKIMEPLRSPILNEEHKFFNFRAHAVGPSKDYMWRTSSQLSLRCMAVLWPVWPVFNIYPRATSSHVANKFKFNIVTFTTTRIRTINNQHTEVLRSIQNCKNVYISLNTRESSVVDLLTCRTTRRICIL